MRRACALRGSRVKRDSFPVAGREAMGSFEGSERLSNLPKDAQLAAARAWVGSQSPELCRATVSTRRETVVSLSPFQAVIRAVSRWWWWWPAASGRPLLGLRCRSERVPRRWEGSRLPTLKEMPLGPGTEKFQMVYRFDAIRTFGYLSRLKVTQTALTVVLLPPGFYLYSQDLVNLNTLYLAATTAGFALAMLCWMSHFFRRLVGILYVNESGTVLRVAHLTFWGRRQDTYCPVADVIPLTETRDRPQEVFVRIQQYSGNQTFYLSLRYGRILDKERFTQVFGTLGTPK
ncbi:transmembrane protein 186 [Echinops telfairi]|uniref:Transmembrane protein 186 n=1 Tax=Echinops telfairi TaxID=9371 RepID=A0AC55CR79_ECHTE|nr:transmembrane protein 186 [Echinops telfairi]